MTRRPSTFTAPENPAVGFVSRSTLKGWLWALSIGILGLWQFHIPQFASGFDKFPGDRGDARLVAYLMEHWYQVFQGTAHWRSPGIFYPVQGTLGYSDLLLGYGIVHSVFRTLGLGIFESAEAAIILLNFLTYFVCFVLLNKVLRFNLAASIAGAAFFAFNNPKLMQLGHPQLQPILFLPLTVIAIILLEQQREKLSQKRAFALIALAMLSLNLQLLTGFYGGWFFIFWSGLFLLITLFFGETRKVVVALGTRFWKPLLGGIAVFLVGCIPFLKAYWPVLQSIGGREYQQIYNLIPVPLSFLLTSPRNYIWGGLSTSIWQQRPEINPELLIGIGLVPSVTWIALTVFAVKLVIRYFSSKPLTSSGRQSNLVFLVALILATSLVYLLGVKYSNGFTPWQYVAAWVPGGRVIRAVSRYVIVMALPMGIAFAWLIDHLSRRIMRHEQRTRRSILLVLLGGVVVFGLVEQFGSKEGFNGFSIKDENLYLARLAQDLPDNCSSFYVAVKPGAPHNEFEYQIDAALVAAIKDVPTLNGYSGHLPPTWSLWEVKASAYENNVQGWIAEHQLAGVCRLLVKETTANVVDITLPEVFVRQQYQDFLGRDPDPSGLQTWGGTLKECPHQGYLSSDPNCDRIYVSMAILSSPEFRERSHFVVRLYLTTLGRPPLYQEFLKDRVRIMSAGAGELKARKQELIAELVQSPEFKTIYDQLANGAFVDKLLQTAANSSAKRGALLAQLNSQQKTRAEVVESVIEDEQAIEGSRNQAFVLMQFFGNLNRDPKPGEYENRLHTLNKTGDYRQLIFDFIYSVEYRKRFGYVN